MKNGENNAFQGLFLNEFDRQLDSQCRISFPSEWRDNSGGGDLVMIPARDRALVMLPLATFLEFVGKAKQFAIANPTLQLAFAYLGANSRQCSCDKQGRIALDRKMLDKIGVGNTVKLIGALTHVRICAPESWQTPDSDDMNRCLDEIQKISDDSGNLAALLGGIMGK